MILRKFIKNIFILLFTFTTGTLYAQNEDLEIQLEMKVLDFMKNGVNQSEMYYGKEQELLLVYDKQSGDLLFYNQSRITNQFSYGKIYDVKTYKTDETDKKYQTATLTFIWKYENSY